MQDMFSRTNLCEPPESHHWVQHKNVWNNFSESILHLASTFASTTQKLFLLPTLSKVEKCLLGIANIYLSS